MSTYWDALERSAQGVPGSAAPRRRALFEDALGVPLETLEEADNEVDARPAATPPPATAAEPPVRVPEGPPINEQEEAPGVALERVPAPAAEPSSAEPRVERAPLLAVAAERGLAAPPAASQAEQAPEPARPKIVEIRHIESRTIVEPMAGEGPGEESQPQPVDLESPRIAQPVLGADREPPPERAEAVHVMPAEPIVREVEVLQEAEAVAPPPIIVEIDSIEVRIEAPAVLAPPPVLASPRETGLAPSLNDYLSARSEASR